MKFNPIRTRDNELKNDASMLKWALSTVFDSNRPMGNVAASEVADVIRFWSVGLYKEVTPIMLPRALEWLNLAIEQDEWSDHDNPNFHRQTLHSAKALALWMQNGDAALDEWKKVCDLAISVIEISWPKNQVKTYGLNDYLCYCIQAEQYAAGVVEYEKYHGAKTISLKKTLSPRDFGYALCLDELTQRFDHDDLFAAGRKMLQANLDDKWLGVGQYQRGALWLKNVYWHFDRSLSPLETILKAYDNMPDVVRPSFV